MLRIAQLLALCLILTMGGASAPCQAPTTFTPTAAFSQGVIKGFRQGQDNDFNCASIALVKVSIANFGPESLSTADHEGVLKTDDISADGAHKIQLHDGSTLTLTSDEIKQAAARSGFTLPVSSSNLGDLALRDRANFLYAVMAKKAYTIHDGSETFADAVTFGDAISILQHGRNFEYLAPLLGLVANDAGDANNLPALSNPAYVYTNNWHAVFSSNDEYDECGDPQNVDSFNGYHSPRFHLFKSSKENWAFTVSFPPTAGVATLKLLSGPPNSLVFAGGGA